MKLTLRLKYAACLFMLILCFQCKVMCETNSNKSRSKKSNLGFKKAELKAFASNMINTKQIVVIEVGNTAYSNESSIIEEGSITFNATNGKLFFYAKFLEIYDEVINSNNILIARGRYTKTLHRIGWSRLFIETFDSGRCEVEAFAAGYIEGKMTAPHILDFYWNLVGIHSDETNELKEVFKYYSEVEQSLREKTKRENVMKLEAAPDIEYWISVAIVQAQTDGLYFGYNSMMKNNQLSFDKFYFINADGEVPELLTLFKTRNEARKNNMYSYSFKQHLGKSKDKALEKFSPEYLKFYFGSSDPEIAWSNLISKSHCTAVIKCVYDSKTIIDLLVAHTTWDSFSEMHRIFKVYDFKFSLFSKQRNSLVMFSSYPGTLTSTDDYYLLNSKISILETTIEILDKDIYKKSAKSSDNHIPNYIRISISNRLSNTGKEWTEYFKQNNSGTYNSQWMIIDYSTLESKRETGENPKGLLYVMEQIPGDIEIEDMTDVLLKQGYWASFNRPYFQSTYNKTGYPEMLMRYKLPIYSYSNNPRAILIGKRIMSISSIDGLKALMQSTKNEMGELTTDSVSPRYDLITDSRFNKASGGIDTKITSSRLAKSNKIHAISGPSYQDNNTPFDWSSYPNDPHYGLPQTWNFSWIDFTYDFIKNSRSQK